MKVNSLILYILVLLIVLPSCFHPKENENIIVLRDNYISRTVSLDKNLLLYGTRDTLIEVKNMETQEIIYSDKIGEQGNAKPVIKGQLIYYPRSRRFFVCKNIKTMQTVWMKPIEGRCSEFKFMDDSTIIASIKGYGMMVFNARTGDKIFDIRYDAVGTSGGDNSPWPLVFDDSSIYASNFNKDLITCFDRFTGQIKWSNRSDGYAGQPLLLGESLFLGVNEFYKGGMVYLFNKRSGKIELNYECNFDERVSPLKHQKQVLFYAYDGRIMKFDVETHAFKELIKLKKKRRVTSTEFGFIDNCLYFEDCDFNVIKFDITKRELTKVYKLNRGLYGIFEYKGKIYILQ